VNRRALVTGAAGGLAAGIAPALARDGFESIAITYRSTPPDATLAAINAAGVSAAAAQIDFLGDSAAVETALANVVAQHGPFDTLVHTVGPLVVKRFERATLRDYREIFEGNVRSAVLAARATLPAMRAAGFGRIVFFGMVGSSETRPFRGFTLYQAAKSALVAFARCLALEEAGHGITVNVVNPAILDNKDLSLEEAQRISDTRFPVGRPATAHDVAEAVKFFAREESGFITGQALSVSGGWML